LNPQELRYTKTHEWVHVEQSDGDQVVTIGLSAYAIEALTDLVYIQLPEVGAKVTAGQSFSEIESVKAVSDIYAPVSGEVVAANDELPDNLDLLSEDPYGKGWIAKIKASDASPLDSLLDHAAYQKLCQEEEH